jgi:hypothetical protein
VLLYLPLLQIEESGLDAVNVREVLLEMRKFRMGLIQTPDQLRFSYWAIMEGSNKQLNGSSAVSGTIISFCLRTQFRVPCCNSLLVIAVRWKMKYIVIWLIRTVDGLWSDNQICLALWYTHFMTSLCISVLLMQSIHSHVFTSCCLIRASKNRRSGSSGFRKCPLLQLPISCGNST